MKIRLDHGTRMIAALLVVLGLVTTRAQAFDIPKPGVSTFSMSAFERNIRDAMDGRTTGYAYAIYQNGVLKKAGGRGKAVLPDTNMTANTRGDLFSMSKTITAAAVMRALEILQARGEQVDIWSPIGDYLPPLWQKGPGVDSITFRELLRHESGLIPFGQQDLYDSIRLTIEHGVDPELVTPPFGNKLKSYCGCNFALLRELVPRMLHGAYAYLWDDILHGKQGAADFVQFARDELLLSAGIDAGVELSGPLPYTRYYEFTNTTNSTMFEVYQPRYLYAGAGFFYMSVGEFASFLDRLRRGRIISPGSWRLMQDDWLGLYHISDSTTAAHGGDYLWHNGGASFNGAGGGGAWVMFPNGVTAVAFHNSVGEILPGVPILGDVTGILAAAFDEAYVTLVPLK